jgi:hypothetical protein
LLSWRRQQQQRQQQQQCEDVASVVQNPPVNVVQQQLQQQLMHELRALLRRDGGTALSPCFAAALLHRCAPGTQPTLTRRWCCVVLERPFVAGLVVGLCTALKAGGWVRPPALQNSELAALELDSGRHIQRWEEAIRAFAAADWLSLGPAARAKECSQLLNALGELGILTLLGQRRTSGSISADSARLLPPPSRDELIEAFERPHKPGVGGCTLSVGGRAMAKHCHRAKRGFFASQLVEWQERQEQRGSGSVGPARNGDASKNAVALLALTTLLEQAVWANTHELPGGVLVHEVRNSQGYGARWIMEPGYYYSTVPAPSHLHFRGFLEPQATDGHLTRWRH